MDEPKTITQQIEDIKEDICMNYCKYPDTYNPDDHDGVELWDSDICNNCPLMRL